MSLVPDRDGEFLPLLRSAFLLRKPTELTIDSGAVTARQGSHTIDTESDAASDNLDTISGVPEGMFLLLRPANDARTVVLRHGVDNIICPGGQDVTMAEDTDYVLLYSDGTNCVVLAAPTLAVSAEGLGAALASTANGKGASLVGIEDAAGLITALTVEAALAEVVKKSNAGLATPMTFEVTLSTLANADVVARFTPGVAGKIRKITAFVRTAATTPAKAATATPYIAGVTVTGGALALTSANCTPKGAKIDGSAITAANAFAAGDEITVVISGVTSFVEGEVVICLFFDPAE